MRYMIAIIIGVFVFVIGTLIMGSLEHEGIDTFEEFLNYVLEWISDREWIPEGLGDLAGDSRSG